MPQARGAAHLAHHKDLALGSRGFGSSFLSAPLDPLGKQRPVLDLGFGFLRSRVSGFNRRFRDLGLRGLGFRV